MILLVVAIASVVLGLVYFTGLWLTVRRVACGAWGPARMAASTVARVGIAAAAFYGIAQLGAVAVLAALAGFLISRWILTGFASRGMTQVETTRTARNGN